MACYREHADRLGAASGSVLGHPCRFEEPLMPPRPCRMPAGSRPQFFRHHPSGLRGIPAFLRDAQFSGQMDGQGADDGKKELLVWVADPPGGSLQSFAGCGEHRIDNGAHIGLRVIHGVRAYVASIPLPGARGARSRSRERYALALATLGRDVSAIGHPEGMTRETDTRYPQPREGITGTERTEDDLLALDDKAVARRLMMMGTAKALYDAVLVGNPAPKVAEMLARMRDPQPGDLVMEVSSSYRRDVDAKVKGFGVLVEHREEWASTDAEWAAEIASDALIDPDRDRFHDHAWYVQYGPAAEDVCRWTNCEFIAIPT